MKKYELREVYAYVETDDTTNEEKILIFGDDGSEFGKFDVIINGDNSTLCIPDDSGNVTLIENVDSSSIDEYSDYVLFQKNENDINYIHLFEKNMTVALGSPDAGEFYFVEEDGKKFASYLIDSELIRFEYLDYFEEDDDIVFEVAPGKFRIFTDYEYNEPEEKEDEFWSIATSEGPTIFYWRKGEIYEETARETTLQTYNNAYLIQNPTTDKYELYGFETGHKKLLYSGKVRTEFGNGIIIDDKQWNDHFDDYTLLDYTPVPYVPEPEPEPQQRPRAERYREPEKTEEKKAGNNGWPAPEDEDRYFGSSSAKNKKKKPWWRFW